MPTRWMCEITSGITNASVIIHSSTTGNSGRPKLVHMSSTTRKKTHQAKTWRVTKEKGVMAMAVRRSWSEGSDAAGEGKRAARSGERPEGDGGGRTCRARGGR